MTNQKIRVLFVFEMLGKPAEHIKKTLEEFVDKLGENDGIELINKKIHEPKPLEDENSKDLFTTFAEVELKAEHLNLVLDMTLGMLPAHVEILEPNEFRIKNFDLSSLLSGLTIKLHKYDEIAKAITIEKSILMNKLRETQDKLNKYELERDKNSEEKKEDEKEDVEEDKNSEEKKDGEKENEKE